MAEDLAEWLALYLLDDAGNVVKVTDDGSGVPVVVQWAMALTDDMRSVCWDTACGCEISTVFLGMDCYALMGPRRPHVFETVVFKRVNGSRSEVVFRRNTCTRDEAMQTHADVLQRVRAGTLTGDGYD